MSCQSLLCQNSTTSEMHYQNIPIIQCQNSFITEPKHIQIQQINILRLYGFNIQAKNKTLMPSLWKENCSYSHFPLLINEVPIYWSVSGGTFVFFLSVSLKWPTFSFSQTCKKWLEEVSGNLASVIVKAVTFLPRYKTIQQGEHPNREKFANRDNTKFWTFSCCI